MLVGIHAAVRDVHAEVLGVAQPAPFASHFVTEIELQRAALRDVGDLVQQGLRHASELLAVGPALCASELRLGERDFALRASVDAVVLFAHALGVGVRHHDVVGVVLLAGDQEGLVGRHQLVEGVACAGRPDVEVQTDGLLVAELGGVAHEEARRNALLARGQTVRLHEEEALLFAHFQVVARSRTRRSACRSSGSPPPPRAAGFGRRLCRWWPALP